MAASQKHARCKVVCVVAVISAAGYETLAQMSSVAEHAAAVVVGAATAALFWTIKQKGGVRFSLQLQWVRRLAPRVLRKTLADFVLLGRALWRSLWPHRQVRGIFRAVRFEPGADDGPSTARRALVTAALSFTPNSFVIAARDIAVARGRHRRWHGLRRAALDN